VGSQLDLQLNIRDIAERKRASAALRQSEERFRLFVDSIRDYALFQLDEAGRIIAWNPGAERLLGWREEEILGRDTAVVFTPEDVAIGEPTREMETARREGTANDDRWHVRKDGTRFFASGVLAAVRDDAGNLCGFAKIMRDITERLQQENQLRRSVEEKSVLVSEIHHRVKNNLQVIVSLLSLQAGHARDPQVLAAFEETESRVRAIAQIHERLYSSPDLAEVEFGAYLTQLVRELIAVNTAKVEAVTLDLHVTDMVLNIEQAIPLGLIANELILNSIKHAFRGGPGRLAVDLAYISGNGNPVPGGDGSGAVGESGHSWARLQVGDSGPGLPKPLDVSGARTMGLRLVNLLVAQLRGRLELGEGPGAKIAVVFPLNLEWSE
jgi:PAS domain S-box-containing protein